MCLNGRNDVSKLCEILRLHASPETAILVSYKQMLQTQQVMSI